MKSSLKKSMLRLTVLFSVLVCSVNVLLSYHNFAAANKRFAYSTSETVARTCSLIINGDVLDEYIASGCRDSEYYELWNKLVDYRNTNEDIIQLSVVRFNEQGMMYIFDADLSDNGAFLRDVKRFDERQEKYRSRLICGEDIGFIEYNDRIVVYEPVFSSYNEHMGYVMVGLSTEHSRMQQINYLIKTTLIAVIVSSVLAFFIFFRFSELVINPIKKLSDAAVNFAASLSDSDGKKSSFSDLKIYTDNEIEELYHSMLQMESNLRTSENNLVVELWNSRHDSMTRLYNKRYLNEIKDSYNERNSLAVFYFDVDNLKKMNDICGHEYGDVVIKKASEFIAFYTPAECCAFRVGGDEFIMIVPDISEDDYKKMLEIMKSDSKRKLTEPDMQVQCRVSLGGSFALCDPDVEALISEADQEMYADKQSRRG